MGHFAPSFCVVLSIFVSAIFFLLFSDERIVFSGLIPSSGGLS